MSDERAVAIPSSRLLRARGLRSQPELAAEIGISDRTLREYETGNLADIALAGTESWYVVSPGKAGVIRVMAWLQAQGVPCGRPGVKEERWFLTPEELLVWRGFHARGLVGREPALAEVRGWWKRPGLYALYGPLGIGKTALLLAARAGSEDVWIDDAMPIAEALAREVGVSSRTPLRQMLGGLRQTPGRGVIADHLRPEAVDELLVAAQATPSVPVVIVSYARPAGAFDGVLELGPLPPRAATTLAARQNPGLPQESLDALVRLAGGVPLLMEQLAAWASTAGPEVFFHGEDTLLHRPDGEGQSRYTAAVARLYGSLPEHTRRALARAAWFVGEIPPAFLADQGEPTPSATLARLASAGLLDRRGEGQFRNRRLVQSVLQSTPESDPAAHAAFVSRHAPVLASLDRRDGDAIRRAVLAELPDSVVAAERDSPHRVPAARVAAAGLTLTGNPAAAARVLAAVQPLTGAEDRAFVAVELGRAARLAGQMKLAREAFLSATTAADPWLRAEAHMGLAAIANEDPAGDPTPYLALARVDLPPEPGPRFLITEANVRYRKGDVSGAEQAMESALVAAREAGETRLEAVLHSNLALVNQARDRPWQARERARAAAKALRALGNLPGLLNALINLLFLEAELGDVDAARAVGEEGTRVAAECGDLAGYARLLCNATHLELLAGRPTDPAAALATAEAVGDPAFLTQARILLGQAALLAGEWGEARERFEYVHEQPCFPEPAAWAYAGWVAASARGGAPLDELDARAEAALRRSAPMPGPTRVVCAARLLGRLASRGAVDITPLSLESPASPSGALVTAVLEHVRDARLPCPPLSPARVASGRVWRAPGGLVTVIATLPS